MTTSPITIIRPKLTRQLMPAEIRARALATICMGNGELEDILMWAAEACPELVIPVEEFTTVGKWSKPEIIAADVNGAATLGIFYRRDKYVDKDSRTAAVTFQKIEPAGKLWWNQINLDTIKGIIGTWRLNNPPQPAVTSPADSPQTSSPGSPRRSSATPRRLKKSARSSSSGK